MRAVSMIESLVGRDPPMRTVAVVFDISQSEYIERFSRNRSMEYQRMIYCECMSGEPLAERGKPWRW